MQRLLLSALAVLTCALFAGSWMARAAAAPQSPPEAAAKVEETDRQRLERKVKKLLKENGTEATQKKSMEQMIGQFAKMGLPAEFGEKFMARFDIQRLIDLGVKVYADHLDEATVDALIAFYETPSGRKLAEATPDITTEMMLAGMEYGQKIGAEVAEEMGK
jgi:uncharacterized protein